MSATYAKKRKYVSCRAKNEHPQCFIMRISPKAQHNRLSTNKNRFFYYLINLTEIKKPDDVSEVRRTVPQLYDVFSSYAWLP